MPKSFFLLPMAEETEVLEISPGMFSGRGVRIDSKSGQVAIISRLGRDLTLEGRVLEKEFLFSQVEETLHELEGEYGEGSLQDFKIEIFPAAKEYAGGYDLDTKITKLFMPAYPSRSKREGQMALLSSFLLPWEQAERLYALNTRKSLGKLGRFAAGRYERLIEETRGAWMAGHGKAYLPALRSLVRHEAAHHLHLSGKLKIDEVPHVMDEQAFMDIFSVRVLGDGFATLVTRDYQQLLPFSQGRFLRGIVERLRKAAATPAPYYDIMAAAGEEILSGSERLYHAAGEYICCTILEAYGIDAFRELFTTRDKDEILLRHAEACELLGSKVQPLM